MIANATHAALLEAVLTNPSDPVPKLILADFLDEQDEYALAAAYRWCAANNKYPHKLDGYAGMSGFMWIRETATYTNSHHVLPNSLVDAMNRLMWYAHTFPEIMQKLAVALQEAAC